MKKLFNTFACIISIAYVCGCVPNYSRTSYSPPPKKNYEFNTINSIHNDSKISVSISEKCNSNTGKFEGFILYVENKTKDDLSIVWNESYYLSNGTTNGGFMFEGVVYSRRTDPKQDLLILPNTSKSIEIYPNSTVQYVPPMALSRSVLPGGWLHNDLGVGEHGAYLKVKGKGIDARIKLILTCSE